jgi:hypothetical protein
MPAMGPGDRGQRELIDADNDMRGETADLRRSLHLTYVYGNLQGDNTQTKKAPPHPNKEPVCKPRKHKTTRLISRARGECRLTTGEVSIWEMNGTNVIGGGNVGGAPGTSWQVIGAEDFNDDGKSDILWQNTTAGQAAIWEMNGTNVIGGGNAGGAPGTSWHAVKH